MKKLLSVTLTAFLLALVLSCGVFGMTASAVETEGYYTYDIFDGLVFDKEVKITKAHYSISGDVVIPSMLGGYPVTYIDEEAFAYCEDLTGITIPKGVTGIDYKAFLACENLTKVTISNSVTSIGGSAFYGCESLKSISIPNSVTSIGSEAFSFCSSLTSVTIPNSVTSIGGSAFYGCESLTSITIPDGVTRIGYDAFRYCMSLKNITIPASVTSIEDSAFEDCDNVVLYCPKSSYAAEYAKENDLSFVYSDGTTQDNAVSGKAGRYQWSVNKKTGVLTLTGSGNMADFTYSTNAPWYPYRQYITSVKLPDTMTKIGNYAFRDCVNLKIFTVPSGVKEIGEAAFSGCSALETVKVYSKNCSFHSNCGIRYRHVLYGYAGSSTDAFANEIGAEFVEIVPEHKHTYSNKCDKTCNTCGAKRTIKHTYTNSCDTSCNVCKATRTITHTYKTTATTKATLTKNGKVAKKCTVCGHSATSTVRYPKTFKLAATSYTYNGKVKTPSVTVKDTAGKTLKKGTDYTVTYASGRKNAGTYKVTVKMTGKYSGTKTLTFKINPRKITSYKLSATSYTYDGKVKTPTVTVKNSSGTKLTKDTHYTVTYASGRKNVGMYKVTVKGKGNYTGTKTLTFKINPPKTTVSKLTGGKKSITAVVTKKTAQVSGYQIQYSTSKSFSSAKSKTLSGNTTTKCTLKDLSAKKTYYVRVRTYKTVNGTKYYSGWSEAKSVKTK